MQVLHVPESEHGSFDLIDIGAERGYLAWCRSTLPAKPTATISFQSNGVLAAMMVSLMALDSDAFMAMEPHGVAPHMGHLEIRWFLDGPRVAMEGPRAEHPCAGLLVWPHGVHSGAASWEDCRHWLLSREAALLAQELCAQTPIPDGSGAAATRL